MLPLIYYDLNFFNPSHISSGGGYLQMYFLTCDFFKVLLCSRISFSRRVQICNNIHTFAKDKKVINTIRFETSKKLQVIFEKKVFLFHRIDFLSDRVETKCKVDFIKFPMFLIF